MLPHHQLSGPPDAPVLVLSNSLGTDMALWDAQAAELGQHYRLLRYDTRGHGRSPVPPGPYTLEALGTDVLDLLDHLRIDRATVCGISLGGLTALWLAVHASARLHGIVAANTAARIGNAQGWNQRIAQVDRDGVASLVDATMLRWFTPGFLAQHLERVAPVQRTFAAISPAGYTACCAALRDADLTQVIASIRVPALVIAGTHDPVTPPSDGQFLAQTIPNARYVELDAAHLSNIEDALAFTAAVQALMRSY